MVSGRRASILLLVLVAAALAGCSFQRRSEGYACETAADCGAGRTCDQGWCVEVGGPSIYADPNAPDADPNQPDGAPADAFVCPPTCTSCEGQICLIQCTAASPCNAAPPVCPPGVICKVECLAGGSCALGVDCSQSSNCRIECTGAGSCDGLLTCGDGPCHIECADGTCTGGIECADACECETLCAGATSCTPPVNCPLDPGGDECANGQGECVANQIECMTCAGG